MRARRSRVSGYSGMLLRIRQGAAGAEAPSNPTFALTASLPLCLDALLSLFLGVVRKILRLFRPRPMVPAKTVLSGISPKEPLSIICNRYPQGTRP